jgi:hypothetical protein
MSGYPYERRPRPERKRRGRLAVRIALLLVVIAFVFAVGVALGEALHQDGPHAGQPQTSLRTLTSLPRG